MRIIGGKFKGRRLNAPRGTKARPTTDRNRESVFNILSSQRDFSIDGARVIDLFAGTGALGLEALSRGATWCLFVETDAQARAAIRGNIEHLDLFGVTRLHRRSAASLGTKPASAGAPFDLAFLDPPYHMDLLGPALTTLDAGGWLSPNAAIVIECAVNEEIALPDGYRLVDERLYGGAKFIFAFYTE